MFYSFGSLTPSASYSCLSRFLFTSTISGCHQTSGLRSILDMWEQEYKKSKPRDFLGFSFGAGNVFFNYTDLSFQCAVTLIPVPVSTWSKGWVCGCPLAAGILSSNPAVGMDVCCECCVLSGRSLCDELITRPEESYRLWCVVVCDLGTLKTRRLWPA